MSVERKVVEVFLLPLGRPLPRAGTMGVGQGDHVVYIQKPGEVHGRAGERSQPPAAVDGTLPVDPEAHRHGGLRDQDLRPSVLAISVGVDPPVIPVGPVVLGKVFGNSGDDQTWEVDGAGQGSCR